MSKAISNKVNEIYKTLNASSNVIPQIVMITKNDNNNGFKWQIAETYYNHKNPTASKQNKLYVNDYQEYLDNLDAKSKAIVVDRPKTAVIIDDIGISK